MNCEIASRRNTAIAMACDKLVRLAVNEPIASDSNNLATFGFSLLFCERIVISWGGNQVSWEKHLYGRLWSGTVGSSAAHSLIRRRLLRHALPLRLGLAIFLL
jgi:hypothetical protein